MQIRSGLHYSSAAFNEKSENVMNKRFNRFGFFYFDCFPFNRKFVIKRFDPICLPIQYIVCLHSGIVCIVFYIKIECIHKF